MRSDSDACEVLGHSHQMPEQCSSARLSIEGCGTLLLRCRSPEHLAVPSCTMQPYSGHNVAKKGSNAIWPGVSTPS